jgi:hypothetical protein
VLAQSAPVTGARPHFNLMPADPDIHRTVDGLACDHGFDARRRRRPGPVATHDQRPGVARNAYRVHVARTAIDDDTIAVGLTVHLDGTQAVGNVELKLHDAVCPVFP